MLFSLEMGMRIRNLGQDFLYISRAENKQFVSDSMMLRCWFDISALIMHAHRRITDYITNSFFEELK
jgi:hypothetical protein